MVDIKNLRIGSHVLVGGVRGTVDGMDMPRPHWIPKYPLIRCKAVVDGERRYCGGNPLSDEIQPIPITPALLEELGFKCTDKGRVQSWWYDFFCLDYLSKKGYFNFGVIHLKYLHELESLYYMICGVELIKE